MEFPKGFLFGTATSALQVEGGNTSTDWWQWEHDPNSPVAEPAGDACDHYHRYPEDIALMGELGLNAYRFTLEWARIEPERGLVSRAALAHYRRMLQTCHDNGITPLVSLQHFTLPKWVAEAGGWAEPISAVRFGHFAQLIAEELGDLIGAACTIVEANVIAENAYMYGIFPPGRVGDTETRDRARLVIGQAHHLARAAFKSIRPDVPVGLTLSMLEPVPSPDAEDRIPDYLAATYGPYLQAIRDDDFLGVQCYSTQHLGPEGPVEPDRGVERTQMWWEYAPEAAAGMCQVLSIALPGMPLIVSENGIATANDQRRVEFIERALGALSDVIAKGADVRGYLHWSFLDNYEWNIGYRATFGLVGFDPVTFERTVKPSARVLGRIASDARAQYS